MWIRAAQSTDSLQIGDLHAASWRSAYRGALSDEFLAGDVVADRRHLWASRLQQPSKKQHVFLVGRGHDIDGFCCVYGAHDEQWGSYLNNIHVLTSLQRKGFGSALLNACAAICLQLYGEGGLYLWVVQANVKAQHFYARYGAENVEESIWDAPGGTTVPLYRFAWKSIRRLKDETANAHRPPRCSLP